MNLPALKEIIEERKEKAIDNLSTSFAKNRMPLEEYERLVEYINKIESERELVVVEKMVAEYSGETPAGKSANNSDDGDDDDDEEEQGKYKRHSRNNLTVLSDRTFSGPMKSWSQYVSVLGSGCIKIRKSHLKKQQTHLNVVSILGDCTIMVESGIQVTNNAIPVLGSSKTNHKVEKEAQAGWPEIIISGTAILGDISVKLLKE